MPRPCEPLTFFMNPSDLTVHSRMSDIIEALPGARRALFARYHLGGCQSCAFSRDETLEELCQRSENLPPDEVLAHLLDSHQHDLTMLMEPAALRDALNGSAPPRLIDIRTREEHEAVAIPGAEFSTQDLQQRLFAGNPDERIVLFDHAGSSVLDQVAWYRGHGLKQTVGLRGGIDAWSLEVDPALPRYRIEFD
jgi:rhodanese-related sulfurtransferase